MVQVFIQYGVDLLEYDLGLVMWVPGPISFEARRILAASRVLTSRRILLRFLLAHTVLLRSRDREAGLRSRCGPAWLPSPCGTSLSGPRTSRGPRARALPRSQLIPSPPRSPRSRPASPSA